MFEPVTYTLVYLIDMQEIFFENSFSYQNSFELTYNCKIIESDEVQKSSGRTTERYIQYLFFDFVKAQP